MCEQMHERTAKLLTQRTKASNLKAQQITTQELTNLGLLVSIFGEETQTLIGRQCSGLQLSLQSQTVIFVQTFHEENRTRLSTVLERETWKKSRLDNSAAYAKLGAIPSLQGLFSKQNEVGDIWQTFVERGNTLESNFTEQRRRWEREVGLSRGGHR